MAQKNSHLLVLRLSAMGDCAMAVPVLRRLATTYPDLQITVLTKPFFRPIFEVIPQIEVISAATDGRHKGLWGLWKLARELHRSDFDLVADLHNVLRSKILRFFFMLFGWKSAKIDKGRAEKKALTRIKDKRFVPLKTSPQRYADVFKDLGFPVDLSQKIPVKKPELSAELADFIGHSTKPWLGIAPFAAHESKTYPEDLMKRLIAELDRANRYKLLLFGGGKKEIPVLKEWASLFPNAICAAGEFSFEKEIELIANLDLMLSMDSGNGHLAAMFRIPVISLWGSTHPYAGFAPFGQPGENQLTPDLKKYPLLPTSIYGKTGLPGYEDAMRSISTAQIMNRIEELLNSEDS